MTKIIHNKIVVILHGILNRDKIIESISYHHTVKNTIEDGLKMPEELRWTQIFRLELVLLGQLIKLQRSSVCYAVAFASYRSKCSSFRSKLSVYHSKRSANRSKYYIHIKCSFIIIEFSPFKVKKYCSINYLKLVGN